MKPSSEEINNWVSGSLNDPFATLKNRANSLLLLRAAPSAMLLGMETAALRICVVKPKSSSFGKVRVAAYTEVTRDMDCRHASRFSCGRAI
jgi:hypothetical protein